MNALTPSSGNVYTDLGFDAAEAANLKLRSQLMIELERWISDQHLTQAAAAQRLEIPQPRVSDLMRGKIGKFSLDTLVNLATKAGLEVTLSVHKAA